MSPDAGRQIVPSFLNHHLNLETTKYYHAKKLSYYLLHFAVLDSYTPS